MLHERQAGVAGPIHGCEHRIAQPRVGVQQIHKARLVVWEQEPEKGQRISASFKSSCS